MRNFQIPGRSAVLSTNGMCATSHPLAAQTAIDILKRGGNAMDAAIAGAVLLGLCEPQMTGIGGDCFVLYSPGGSNEILAINGSGRAPAAADAQTLRSGGLSTIGQDSASAVTVPGAIDAFCRLSESVGTIGLDAILAPSIHYAKNGVPVAPRVAYDWCRDASILNSRARDLYLVNGKVPNVGQMFHAPGQADVLLQVAKNGRDAFYTGEIAEDMVNTLNQIGGVHTLEDFANTRCDETVPVSGTYRGLEVVEHPPNGQGATAILMLNILSQFDIAEMDPFGAQRAHLEAEAAKLAYDARDRFIADVDHTTRTDYLIAPETAVRLAELIDPKKAMPDAKPLAESVHRDTVYITVVDKDRMAVSLIYSIYHGFGSGIASNRFGILLQSRGTGFNLTKGHPNELGGGKRPMHTIIPGMVRKNNRVAMPFGVMGGAYQPNGHARLISNLRDFDMDPQAAVDAPRSFSYLGEMKLEQGYSDSVRQELAEMGHEVMAADVAIGGAQAITIDESGVLTGASDPRKDGCALGY